MAVLSGKAGTLKLAGGAVTPITNWKLMQSTAAKFYAANDTGGAYRRLRSVEDSSGTFECQVTQRGRCPVERGENVVAQFHVDSSGDNYYQVPVIIDAVEVECDIGTGRLVAFAVAFSGDGAVTAHGVLARRDG
jgi:hypothetical protein